MYKRKTRDIWDIKGDYGYGNGFEIVTSATSWSKARSLIKDYRMNEPGVPFKFVKTREKIEEEAG